METLRDLFLGELRDLYAIEEEKLAEVRLGRIVRDAINEEALEAGAAAGA